MASRPNRARTLSTTLDTSRSFAVSSGARVHPGQGLVVMEAMKMENELRAQAEATVKAVHAQPGAAVETA